MRFLKMFEYFYSANIITVRLFTDTYSMVVVCFSGIAYLIVI